MIKRCSCCKLEKAESEFNWKIKSVRRAYYCRDCSRRYIKAHYVKNTEYYLKKARVRDAMVRNECHDYLGKYLEAHHCVDCDESDILVLEFDHRDRNNKMETVGSIIRRGFSFDKLIQEVLKCDVRCANCHRRKTEIENNSWKLKYALVA